ncbi:MAG: LysR substrate-binding domain-containing protein [Hyphomicrobiales bacterium]|nr:LysR substrate-binding domain-containing protein [Hyphomicrobiales bacterium]
MKCYDSLRVFDVVARHLSFTEAGRELNLTKGAISYQIGRLESELGFNVFHRQHRRIVLTEKGEKLWHASQAAFGDLDRQIADLKDAGPERITVGMSTYFASRWLSPRLMHFITDHPSVGLRLQPLVDLIDLEAHGIDMAIRWGRGQWTDVEIEPLLPCPAFVTAGPDIARRVATYGLPGIIGQLALLHDRDGSEAWHDWHTAAGLPYANTRNELVIADPNVRVQAVIDGQGIALNDDLIADEITAGRLSRISAVELADYGYYLAYPFGALDAPALQDFRDWIMAEAAAS